MYRIGTGYDVHRLVEGPPLILGGVRIPFELGLQGHSDADVLTHALMDALLGALSLGDIGTFFPDTDEKYCGACSVDLLFRVAGLVREKNYGVVNADCVVIAQKPKLQPYLEEIKEKLSGCIAVEPENLGIKATTHEGLGELGRGEGIASYCVVLLEKR